MQAREISAVVTAWNNASSIRHCLESLRETGISEIVLCDCGSSDATLEIVAREYPDVVILSRDGGFSFAEARNLGLKQTSSAFVLFLEGDWCAGTDSVLILHRMLSSLSDMRLAVAVARFEDDDGMVQIGHNIRRFPTARALCMELLLLHKLFPKNTTTQQYRMLDFSHDENCLVDHACGAFILARRDALLEAGGYDENFAPAWMEDVDLHQRLARLDWKTIFCCRATARHVGRETTRHFIIENRYDDFYRGVLRYCNKYLHRYWQTVRACVAAGMCLRILFSYVLPPIFRTHLLSRYRIYVSDGAIQSYKQLYLRTLLLALLKGDPYVSRDKPTETSAGLRIRSMGS